MKKMHVLAMVSCLAAPLFAADKPEAGVVQPTTILLVAAAAIDSATLEGVRATMQTELHVAVSGTSLAAAKSMADALQATTAAPAPKFCRVIFWQGHSALADSFLLLPDAKAVLVDITPLLADKPDAKRLGERLERQAMRGTGLLLGLEYVKGPPCTLKRVRSLQELDSLSRNFSPPAQGRFRTLILLEGGVLLDQPDPE